MASSDCTPLRTKANRFTSGLGVAALVWSICVSTLVSAQLDQPDRTTLQAGESIVTKLCASCHVVSAADQNSHPDAPDFRSLSQNYPVRQLEEALAEGIMTGHPDMPVFEFDIDEIEAIIAYLESIQAP